MRGKHKRAILLLAGTLERGVLPGAMLAVAVIGLEVWRTSDFAFICNDVGQNSIAPIIIAGVVGVTVGILAGAWIAMRVSRMAPGWKSTEW